MAHGEDMNRILADGEQHPIDAMALASEEYTHLLAVDHRIRVDRASGRVLLKRFDFGPDRSCPAQGGLFRFRLLEDPSRCFTDLPFGARLKNYTVRHFRVLGWNSSSS